MTKQGKSRYALMLLSGVAAEYNACQDRGEGSTLPWVWVNKIFWVWVFFGFFSLVCPMPRVGSSMVIVFCDVQLKAL